MNYLSKQIVFQEIPDEISLSYLITGCPLRCQGCHSSDSWRADTGRPLTMAVLQDHLLKYSSWISCVLFMGGEWQAHELRQHCQLIRSTGLKTALYTGLESAPADLLPHLDYVKLGRYRYELGGLQSTTTNQRLIHVATGKVLLGNLQLNNNMNDKGEVRHDSLK